jgi:hypothetical protein
MLTTSRKSSLTLIVAILSLGILADSGDPAVIEPDILRI